MKCFFRRLSEYCTLLYEVTKANYKLQTENSLLGMVWYLLGPLLLFGIMLFVFSHRLGAEIEHYPLYLLMGIISWNFFATGTGRSMTTIAASAELIKSLPIRPELLVLGAVMHALISHVFELALLVGILIWYGIPPVYLALYLSVLGIAFCLTLGVGFALSALYVFLRDTQQIWNVFTRAWWFATPIFYAPLPSGPGMKLSLWNPLYYHIHLGRELLIYRRIPEPSMFAIFALFALAALITGIVIFRALRPNFISLL